VVIIDLGLNCYFYLQQDYTSIFKVDLFLLLGIAVVFKPLFRDAKMQWFFSYVTVLNIYSAIVFLEAFLYIGIFLFLKVSSDRYDLREEKIKSDARQELLQLELAAQDEFVSMARQNRHDLRHHNALLADYLNRGDVEGAKKYLRQHDALITETVLRQYCKNPVVNAVLRLYGRRAEQNGIAFSVSADIPEQLPLTTPEIGELFSNLLENACEACERSSVEGCFIALSTHMEEGRLRLELRNTVGTETAFDRAGLPLSQKSGGGTGTRSMVKIMKKYGGMLRFKQKNDVLFTQIILPPN
jgi:sensor histidine kinase regulating citrate/malate metabolism